MTTTQKLTLEERVQLLEDQHAIYQLISAYGPAADACNLDDIRRLWHEDCRYEIGGLGRHEGHAGIQRAFDEDFLQGVVKAGSGYVSGFPHAIVDGDRAVATHHATRFTHREGQYVCIRLIASRWKFVRTRGKRWQIKRRKNILLNGNPEAPKLLAQTMVGPEKQG